jgi:hypothetical protein
MLELKAEGCLDKDVFLRLTFLHKFFKAFASYGQPIVVLKDGGLITILRFGVEAISSFISKTSYLKFQRMSSSIDILASISFASVFSIIFFETALIFLGVILSN